MAVIALAILHLLEWVSFFPVFFLFFNKLGYSIKTLCFPDSSRILHFTVFYLTQTHIVSFCTCVSLAYFVSLSLAKVYYLGKREKNNALQRGRC